LNVSTLETCSVIHDTVEKSRNKHKVLASDLLLFSQEREELQQIFDCGKVNPLTPELNPSAQSCLPRFFTGDFNL
jgi:hypothetical protein